MCARGVCERVESVVVEKSEREGSGATSLYEVSGGACARSGVGRTGRTERRGRWRVRSASWIEVRGYGCTASERADRERCRRVRATFIENRQNTHNAPTQAHHSTAQRNRHSTHRPTTIVHPRHRPTDRSQIISAPPPSHAPLLTRPVLCMCVPPHDAQAQHPLYRPPPPPPCRHLSDIETDIETGTELTERSPSSNRFRSAASVFSLS